MNLTNRPVMQKDPRYENRRLLDLCHGAPCVLNFAGCTGGTNPDEPSVPCHSDWLEDGKGVGYKAHDHTAVPGCPSCHRMLDSGGLPTEYRKRFFRAGQQKWWAYLWQNDLVKVA
jgi:hypothetical protein